MTTRTIAFRIDMWTPDGASIIEHIAGVEDCSGDLSGGGRALARRSNHAAARRAGDRGLPSNAVCLVGR
jgi:hypothetical protein